MTTTTRTVFFFVFLISECAVSQNQPLQFASIFTDSMVLQQQREVVVWGKGVAGKKINVESSWKNKASTVVDNEGSWSVRLKTVKAGGPYQVMVSDGDTTIRLKDVLLGEVWLCSGQSNMEMPLEGWPPTNPIMNSDSEISNAKFPIIRLFGMKKAYSIKPETSCEGKWVQCTPQNAKTFSAAAYFFGRTLFQQLNVPIGLIHASWGGTAIESWMSKQSLSKFDNYLPMLKRIEDNKDSIDALNRWIIVYPVIKMAGRTPETNWQNLDFNDSVCTQKQIGDSLWREMKLPTLWERTDVGNFDGAVWFRKRVTIPSGWVGKELTLDLGPIDDMDETYVNGQNVGSHLSEGMWQVPRTYTIPAKIVQDSILQIAIRVIDYGGGGGIFGAENSLHVNRADTTLSIPLAGQWKYLPVAEFRAGTFYVFGSKGQEYFNRPKLSFDFSGYSPTALFNGMISPLVPFTLRGVIWYQGESNVGNPKMYMTLFPLMISEWRTVFHSENMPFYYVQIAPYKYDPPSESQFLREAQFKTLSLKNTGMVVTLDIGNPNDIHPANKQDVGKRLASWALAKTYNKKTAFSGPVYRSMKIKRNTIVLSFDYADKGMVIREHPSGNEFQIAGEDSVFKNAIVNIKGKTLVVSHLEIAHPKAVRYLFSNASEATLFNKDGLPASSFRTDDWSEKK
jgi:sialate O-acetylesterase